MKTKLLFIIWVLFALEVQAQDRTITGKVVDQTDQQPLPGVSIRVSGQKSGTLTNTDGTFSIRVAEAEKSLLFSYIGYLGKTVQLRDIGKVIALEPDLQQLSEVVVTGYSTQERKFIAGSITTLKGEDLTATGGSGFNQLIQGKAAGVQVSSNSGVPGGGITFRIRGNNSINASVEPLYVIDGVFVNSSNSIRAGLGNQTASNPLADINPEDIESLVILKDASATAIYGSMGANGVVLVTTKRGSLNTKAKINLSTYQGWSEAVNKFKSVSGAETAMLANEAVLNTGLDQKKDPSTIVLPFADPTSQPTYDRVSGLFRTAKTSNYEVSAQGGSATSTYYTGVGYLKQESVVKPSDFERFTGRFNYDNRLTDRLKIGTSFNFTRTERALSGSDNNPTGVINSAIFPRSYLPIYKPDGTYARYGSFDNHLALIENLDNHAVGWRTIGNVFGEYTILPELKLRTSWSIDNNSVYENSYSNTLISAGIASNGSAASYETKNLVLTNEQVLTYIKSFGENKNHNINALVGNTIYSKLYETTSASGTGFATNSLRSIDNAAIRSGSSARSQNKMVSFFGKASYTYDNKYTIDGSIRADASSKFGINKQWGYFPSGGLTWRAGQETFIKDLNIFDELKFRGSIGLSGNQNGIDDYAALGLWSAGYNYLETAGTAPSQLANPDLTWETTRQIDLGTEFSILKKRLNVSFDYYNKYTYDLLLNVPVPYRSGFSSYLQNYGAVRNKGLELSISSVNVETKNFSWTTEFNVSKNNNKIEKLASDITLGASGRNISILREGYAVNSFQLYKQLYVDPKTGNAVYDDVNGDGLITSADRQIVGNALPKYTGGLNNTVKVKNFDLNVFFIFQQGNKIMNMNDFFLVHGGTQSNIGFLPRQLERWHYEGQQTDIPRMTTFSGDATVNGGSANNYGGNVASLSSRYLEDGSFIRLKNVSLGYTIPTVTSARWGISRARIYVSGSNLLTFTKYKGLDPEVSSQSSNQNTAGYDWATVPQSRTIQVGVNVSL